MYKIMVTSLEEKSTVTTNLSNPTFTLKVPILERSSSGEYQPKYITKEFKRPITFYGEIQTPNNTFPRT